MRFAFAGALLTVALVGCASGELTVVQYASRVEALVAEMEDDFSSIDSTWVSRDPALDRALEYWERRLEIREDFLDEIIELEPPDGLVPMHEAALDVFRKINAADVALAARVATFDAVTDHEQWLATREGQASLAVLEEVFAFCRSSQDEFDATADRVGLADVPWVPPEMKQTVKVAFGCPPAAP